MYPEIFERMYVCLGAYDEASVCIFVISESSMCPLKACVADPDGSTDIYK